MFDKTTFAGNEHRSACLYTRPNYKRLEVSLNFIVISSVKPIVSILNPLGLKMNTFAIVVPPVATVEAAINIWSPFFVEDLLS